MKNTPLIQFMKYINIILEEEEEKKENVLQIAPT